MPKLPPSEPGKGRELIPNHTGGNQTGLGPFTELAPGFPAQEQEPQIYINPDQSDEIRGQMIFLNEEGTPIYDGIPISERFIHKAGQNTTQKMFGSMRKAIQYLTHTRLLQLKLNLLEVGDAIKSLLLKRL